MTHVTAAELRRCEIPLQYEYQLSNKRLTHAEVVLLRLTDSAGNVGIGEANAMVPFTHQHSAISIEALLREFLPDILSGVDIRNINALHERIDAVLGAENVLPRSPIDVAAHDLKAKALGVPLHELLGGSLRDGIEILKPLGSDPVEANVEKAQRDVADGFTSLMLKTGHFPVETDLERLEAVRDAVGADVDIVVDANQGWDERQAIQFAERAEPFDVEFIEQPVPASDIDGLRRIRDSSPIPISADESLFTLADARRLIDEQAVDVFSIKVAKHGGIHHTKRIIELADTYGIPVFMNSMIETGVSQSASLHLGVSSPNVLSIGHAYMSPLRLADNVTDYREMVTESGTVEPADANGLGVTLTEGLHQYTVETHEIELN